MSLQIAQFWTGFAPTGYGALGAAGQVESFFEAYLSFFIVAFCYIGYKLVFRTKFVKTKDIDIMSGRREMDLSRILAEERAEKMNQSRWRRAWKILC